MAEPFVCPCKRKTTNPYNIAGVLLCVVCAEEARPDIVGEQVTKDAREWTRSSWKSPHGGPGWSPRKTD